MKTNLFLINDRSGAVSAMGAKKCIQELSQTVNGPVHIEVASGDPSRLVETAISAAASGDVGNVYMAGGDGTCAAVAGALADSGITLIPLPGGTMNAFSRDLGYSADLCEAIEQIPAGKPRHIDIAFVNEHPFLNNVVFGAYTTVAESREHLREADGVGEVLDSLVEIAGSITHAEANRYKVTIDGVVERVLTNTLMVSNNLYDGADEWRPTRTQLNQGQLGCYLAKSKTAIDFLTVLMDAVTGKMTDSGLMDMHPCLTCTVESASKILEISIDGEAKELPSPVTLTIRPRALRVLAPASAP